ncbi:MAG: D-alanine--D-alanine ligase [Opitutales bacterium]
MAEPVRVVVLYGGTSEEREVSLASGAAVAEALGAAHEVERIRLDAEILPDGLDPEQVVVFPALHGRFGEDGQLQGLLEAAGIDYAGSDARASRLCMDKADCKAVAVGAGLPTPDSIVFDGAQAPLADAVIEELGASLVVKPADQGSSVGLHFAGHRSALGLALSRIHSGKWLIEQRIRGRELTVGILDGQALGIVEVLSASGVYDYEAKYTPGSTEYRYPAELDPALEKQIKARAERMFAACGCRDFARIDFLLDDAQAYFLEINTLPGLTATSLLPKSAACMGYDFSHLAAALVAPALERHARRRERRGA